MMDKVWLLLFVFSAGCATQQAPYSAVGKDPCGNAECIVVKDGTNAGVYCKPDTVLDYYKVPKELRNR